jgi:plastocyanin
VIRHPLALLAVAAVGLLPVLAGCGGDDEKASTEPTTTSTTETTDTTARQNVNDHGTRNLGGDDEAEVELDDDYFAPTTIQGRPGQTVKLELRNQGNALHNFTLTAQNIDRDVDAGEDAKVNVNLPRSAKVEFFCKYHRGQGMAGFLASSGSGGSGSGSSGSGSSDDNDSLTTPQERTTESDGSGSGPGY